MARVLEFTNDDIFSMHAREEMLLCNARENFISFSRLRKPSISIGRLQNHQDVLEDRTLEDNVAVTRRKTGGRFMYLDENDVIVSFAISNKGGIRDVYDSICDLVIKSLEQVTGEQFHIEYVNDIIHDSGRKIGGAAQSRDDAHNRSMVHVYLRHGADLNKLFRYCALDGNPLEDYVSDLARYVTSVSDIRPNISFTEFYSAFYDSLVQRFGNFVGEDMTESELSLYEQQKVRTLRSTYNDPEYINGKSDFPSRGHCDAIAGSGSSSILKIPELVGKVSYG